MPTAKQITQAVIEDLMQLEIIKLLHPETRTPLAIDHEAAQNVVQALATNCTNAIKGINDHRPLEQAPVLCAPFPGMDEPWSQEKIDELDEVLTRYEKAGDI